VSLLLAAFACRPVHAAGLLKPVGSGQDGVYIKSHHVDVTINNGFARTEIDQVFGNDTDYDIEAIYSLPLPKQASLSEVSLWVNGQEILGEVVEKEKAKKIYEEQVAKGNDVALAEKDGFRTFDINVGRVPAHTDTRVRLVYYQPLEIDLNVGRYVYPLSEGGVDEERIAFWSVDDRVKQSFRFNLELKSAFPVRDVRVPGYEQVARITSSADNAEGIGDVYTVTVDSEGGATLSKDLVVYYRLDDQVPARVELVPYRASRNEPGTFMLVVTPAASLQRIAEGTDWTFILDVSGSMSGHKIATLADGVSRVIGKMAPNDRFRIVTFNNQARDITGGYVTATPEQAGRWIRKVKEIKSGGGTALFAGLKEGYRELDADRTSGVILVTDGVCNIGPTHHKAFLELINQQDIRLFTFVIGNSANQPLLERLAKDSGGFAMNISNADDILGRLIQAKAKVLHECMHDVEIKIRGEKVCNVKPDNIGNLYMGQQAVLFGQYTNPGEVDVELRARISGEQREWHCRTALPEVDTRNPELERLWALAAIDEVMQEIREKDETPSLRKRVVDLALEYQLVTDYTSMLVVQEDVLEGEGIQRRNADRVKRERDAQQKRAAAPVRSHRVDNGSTFQHRSSPGLGIGSGPVGPLFLVLTSLMARRKRK
jgi:Ca-activated chloride channel family protein